MYSESVLHFSRKQSFSKTEKNNCHVVREILLNPCRHSPFESAESEREVGFLANTAMRQRAMKFVEFLDAQRQ